MISRSIGRCDLEPTHHLDVVGHIGNTSMGQSVIAILCDWLHFMDETAPLTCNDATPEV